MALSTIYTFLMHKASGQEDYAKLVDITDFPDLRPAPETIEVTTMSVDTRQYILGLKDSSDRTFTFNYDENDFDTLKALEGQVLDLAVWIGGTKSGETVTPTGAHGKIAFKGMISVSLNGAGVGDAHTGTITVATQSEDTFSKGTT